MNSIFIESNCSQNNTAQYSVVIHMTHYSSARFGNSKNLYYVHTCCVWTCKQRQQRTMLCTMYTIIMFME